MWITTDERLAMLAKVQRLIWLKQCRILLSGKSGTAKKSEVLKEIGINQLLSDYMTEVIAGRQILKTENYNKLWNKLNSL